LGAGIFAEMMADARSCHIGNSGDSRLTDAQFRLHRLVDVAIVRFRCRDASKIEKIRYVARTSFGVVNEGVVTEGDLFAFHEVALAALRDDQCGWLLAIACEQAEVIEQTIRAAVDDQFEFLIPLLAVGVRYRNDQPLFFPPTSACT
jgi:hypothetical protein